MLNLEFDLRQSLQSNLYQRAAEVVKLCLSDEAVLHSSIFDNIELTERSIMSRHRLLSRIHPDYFPGFQNNDVFERFFQILSSEIERALDQLQSNIGSADRIQNIIYHEEKGNHYWKLFVDWKEVIKGNYHNIKELKRENYEYSTDEERIKIKSIPLYHPINSIDQLAK